jgi:hypothetical protein
MAFGFMHIGPALVEPSLSFSVRMGAVLRTAHLGVAVRRHRSSNRVHPRVPREH